MSFSEGSKTRRDIPWSDFQFQPLGLACVDWWQAAADSQYRGLGNVHEVKIGDRRQRRLSRANLGVATRVPDLHQLRLPGCRRSHWHRLQVLRVPPVIQYSYLLYARNSAPGCAELLGGVLSVAHLRRVLRQRNPRIPPLLRAPVHQPVFTNVQVARARAAAPVVFLPTRHVVLKLVESRKRSLPQLHHSFKNFLLVWPQWFQLTVVVMNDPHLACETQLHATA